MKKTIHHVIRAAKLGNFDVSKRVGSVNKATKLYEVVEKYFRFPSTHHRRFTELTWKTIFLELQKTNSNLLERKSQER